MATGHSHVINVPTGAVICAGKTAAQEAVRTKQAAQEQIDVRPYPPFGSIQCGIANLMNYGYIPPSVNAVHDVISEIDFKLKELTCSFFVVSSL